MTPTKPLSDFDCDRVVVTLRRVHAIAQDLRQEYPDAFENTGVYQQHANAESVVDHVLPSGT